MANIEANRPLIRRHGDVLQTVTAGTFIEATTPAKTPQNKRFNEWNTGSMQR